MTADFTNKLLQGDFTIHISSENIKLVSICDYLDRGTNKQVGKGYLGKEQVGNGYIGKYKSG